MNSTIILLRSTAGSVWRLFCIAVLLASPAAIAQCVNTVAPSCQVYANCFAKICDCSKSPYEYFTSYGEKYCKTFLDLNGLSSDGRKWRDSTLRCLQENTYVMLPPTGTPATCDCKSIQLKAFDQHVACYTQPGNSICDLGAADWVKIADAADAVTNLVDQKSRKQMLEVVKICLPVLAGDAKKSAEQLAEKLK